MQGPTVWLGHQGRHVVCTKGRGGLRPIGRGNAGRMCRPREHARGGDAELRLRPVPQPELRYHAKHLTRVQPRAKRLHSASNSTSPVLIRERMDLHCLGWNKEMNSPRRPTRAIDRLDPGWSRVDTMPGCTRQYGSKCGSLPSPRATFSCPMHQDQPWLHWAHFTWPGSLL